ncbi:MAG: ABC transporter permease [Lysobacterales bacterium]
MTEAAGVPPRIEVDRTADAETARACGAWTVDHAASLDSDATAAGARQYARIDASEIEALDSTGAMLLLRVLPQGDDGRPDLARLDGLTPQRAALMRRVVQALSVDAVATAAPSALGELLAHIGEAVLSMAAQAKQLLGFLGLLITTWLRVLPRPVRWRLTSVVHHLEQTGLNAVPIVALLSFLVGAVVAYLGATVLEQFGAGLYTVDLIGFAFLREFGGLLAAILVAGRSGSAFTAQIGAMKNREEIDALETIGLDPIEVLVLPRLAALLVALPILTFIAMMAGIVGGMAVGATSLDISPVLFITRLQESIPPRHFWVGMVKAPFFALLIALVGCLEGFKVSGSAESVGAHTTSSVVQSIFLVILVDAICAVAFMELDL